METNNRSEIKVELSKGPIVVEDVYKSSYQKEGTMSAQLRQVVSRKTYYPGISIADNLQDNIFKQEDYNFKQSEPFVSTENRVAWINVPEGETVKSVQERIDKHRGATLYRILSNKPILTVNQEKALQSGNLDVNMDTFAERQVVKFPSGHEKEGDVALDRNGKVQYRVVKFSSLPKKDVDIRTSEKSDQYTFGSLAETTSSIAEEDTPVGATKDAAWFK